MPRTRRGRMVSAAILSLALGISTTVVIAWSLALWLSVPMYPRTTLGAFLCWERPWHMGEVRRPGVIDCWWGDEQPENPGQSPREIVEREARDTGALVATRPGSSLRTTRPDWGTFAQAAAPTGAPHLLGCDTAYGWPLPCLWFQVIGSYNDASHVARAETSHGAILLSTPDSLDVRGHDYRAVPFFPLWPGLLVDTCSFASAWWLLLFAPAAARHGFRRRRGRCPRCGYDLRAIRPADPCPECGAPR